MIKVKILKFKLWLHLNGYWPSSLLPQTNVQMSNRSKVSHQWQITANTMKMAGRRTLTTWHSASQPCLTQRQTMKPSSDLTETLINNSIFGMFMLPKSFKEKSLTALLCFGVVFFFKCTISLLNTKWHCDPFNFFHCFCINSFVSTWADEQSKYSFRRADAWRQRRYPLTFA